MKTNGQKVVWRGKKRGRKPAGQRFNLVSAPAMAASVIVEDVMTRIQGMMYRLDEELKDMKDSLTPTERIMIRGKQVDLLKLKAALATEVVAVFGRRPQTGIAPAEGDGIPRYGSPFSPDEDILPTVGAPHPPSPTTEP